MSFKTVNLSDEARVRDIDSVVKNKFSWTWLNEEISIPVKNEAVLQGIESDSISKHNLINGNLA
jgi:hypothetical protein